MFAPMCPFRPHPHPALCTHQQPTAPVVGAQPDEAGQEEAQPVVPAKSLCAFAVSVELGWGVLPGHLLHCQPALQRMAARVQGELHHVLHPNALSPTPSTPKNSTAPSTHQSQQHPLVALVVQDLACLLQQRLLLHVVDWHPALHPPHGRERSPLAVQHVRAVGTAAAVYAGSAHRAVATQGRTAKALYSKRRVARVAVATHGLPRCQAVVRCGWARAGQASGTVFVSL